MYILHDLDKTIITFDNVKSNQSYNVLSNRFLEVVHVHAPLKSKIVTIHLLLINNSEMLFIPKRGWKRKYKKIPRKKTKWHVKCKESFVYHWEGNVWKLT